MAHVLDHPVPVTWWKTENAKRHLTGAWWVKRGYLNKRQLAALNHGRPIGDQKRTLIATVFANIAVDPLIEEMFSESA